MARDCEFKKVDNFINEKRRLPCLKNLNAESHRDMLKEIKTIEKIVEENLHLVAAFDTLKTGVNTRFDAYKNALFLLKEVAIFLSPKPGRK